MKNPTNLLIKSTLACFLFIFFSCSHDQIDEQNYRHITVEESDPVVFMFTYQIDNDDPNIDLYHKLNPVIFKLTDLKSLDGLTKTSQYIQSPSTNKIYKCEIKKGDVFIMPREKTE